MGVTGGIEEGWVLSYRQRNVLIQPRMGDYRWGSLSRLSEDTEDPCQCCAAGYSNEVSREGLQYPYGKYPYDKSPYGKGHCTVADETLISQPLLPGQQKGGKTNFETLILVGAIPPWLPRLWVAQRVHCTVANETLIPQALLPGQEKGGKTNFETLIADPKG
jgi:hypothetical protein